MFVRPLTGTRSLSSLCFLLIAISLTARAQSRVTLAWNASIGSGIAGYRAYSGGSSRTYTNMMDVGNVTTATVTNLVPGTTYYFAVTAYDLAGLESAFSTEISFTAATTPVTHVNLSLSFTGTNEARLTGSAPSGYSYDVLASPDLLNWTVIGNAVSDATGLLEFKDPGAANAATRYYRLRQTSP